MYDDVSDIPRSIADIVREHVSSCALDQHLFIMLLPLDGIEQLEDSIETLSPI